MGLLDGRRWRGVDKRLLVLMVSCWVLGVVTLLVEAVALVAGETSVYRPAQVAFPVFFIVIVVSSAVAARQYARRDR